MDYTNVFVLKSTHATDFDLLIQQKLVVKLSCCITKILNHQFFVVYEAHKKKVYDNIKNLSLTIIDINGKSDLKVVALVMGLQRGFTKHWRFLCESDYIKKNWLLCSPLYLGGEKSSAYTTC